MNESKLSSKYDLLSVFGVKYVDVIKKLDLEYIACKNEISLISNRPKEPIKPFILSSNNIKKPLFTNGFLTSLIIFILLVLLSFLFPFMFITEWFLEKYNTNYIVWFSMLAFFSTCIQLYIYSSDLSEYRKKKKERDLFLLKYNKSLKSYELILNQFEHKYGNEEQIEIKKKQLLNKLSSLKSKISAASEIPSQNKIIPIKENFTVKEYTSKNKTIKKMGLIEEAKEKLSSEVLNIENRIDLTDDQKVIRICTVFSTTCAAVAVQPIPFADIFVLTPIQAFMGKKIADIRGFDISEAGAKEIFKEIAGLVGLGFLSQQLVIGAYKTVLPFISGVTTIPLVFGLTYGMGKVMDYYFEKKIKGEKVDPEIIRSIFKKAKSEGKQKSKENKEEINKQKNEF
jgi:uncharacterized protein (DUF697 family)